MAESVKSQDQIKPPDEQVRDVSVQGSDTSNLARPKCTVVDKKKKR